MWLSPSVIEYSLHSVEAQYLTDGRKPKFFGRLGRSPGYVGGPGGGGNSNSNSSGGFVIVGGFPSLGWSQPLPELSGSKFT